MGLIDEEIIQQLSHFYKKNESKTTHSNCLHYQLVWKKIEKTLSCLILLRMGISNGALIRLPHNCYGLQPIIPEHICQSICPNGMNIKVGGWLPGGIQKIILRPIKIIKFSCQRIVWHFKRVEDSISYFQWKFSIPDLD